MSSLDPSPEEIRDWGKHAVDLAADYFGSIRERRVYPQTSAKQIREQLDHNLPIETTDFETVLASFRDVVVELSRHNSHPRMFGYVQGPGIPISAIADLLASALNANLTAWRSAPSAVEVERLVIGWIQQIVGCEDHGAGLFVSGGSMANFAALAAARRNKAPEELVTRGARLLPQVMRVYASEGAHHSIAKAATLLGIGRDNVRPVAVDDRGRMRIEHLIQRVTGDLEAGHLPFCVVANAGTVMTGAFDPLAAISEVARRFNLWMHVDACYGGFAAMAASARPLFAGITEADSIALDPHKWLYLPLDCGCLLYRDAEAARATFAHEAEYTRVIAQEADEAFAFWDYGPELSRRFRALKLWMTLKVIGVRRLAQAIEENLSSARYFEQLVQASDDFEMLAPVELSIFCFRYVPPRMKFALAGTDEIARGKLDLELDRLNERLLVQLQRDGSSYLSNALVRGRFALRGCVMNYRTTLRDMEILLDDLRRAAAEIETH